MPFPGVRRDVAIRLASLVADGLVVEVRRHHGDAGAGYVLCRIAGAGREVAAEDEDATGAARRALAAWDDEGVAPDAVEEASEESFPASDAPAW